MPYFSPQGLNRKDDDKLKFRDDAIYINSSQDGRLDLNTNGTIQLNAPGVSIGTGSQEDISLVFDGNVGDIRLGIDDSADHFEIGAGHTFGTYASIKIDVTNGDIIGFGTATPDSDQILKWSGTSVTWADESGGGSGTITGVTGGDGLTGEGTTGSVTLAVGAGNGITVNADDIEVNGYHGITVDSNGVAVNAADGIDVSANGVSVSSTQTIIQTITNANLVVGSSNEQIKFSTSGQVRLVANSADQVLVKDGVFGPVTDDDVDLGESGTSWKDAHIGNNFHLGGIMYNKIQTISTTTTGASSNAIDTLTSSTVLITHTGSAVVQTYTGLATGRTEGQLLHIFFSNDAAGKNVKLDFGTNGLYTGTGTNQYLTFQNNGESATMIYTAASGSIGAGWRLINTGATVS